MDPDRRRRLRGMHTALRLERLLRPGEATVMVTDPRPYMTYQPLLAEAAAANLEPRHVVVPLRGVLRRNQVIKATVSSVDHGRRVACLTIGDGGDRPRCAASPPGRPARRHFRVGKRKKL